MRWEQILGTTLYYQITGRAPANPEAAAEIASGNALLADPDNEPLKWGGSQNQQALGAAVAWCGGHPKALPAVERLLDRELNGGIFAGETLSSYGAFNLGALAAIAAEPAPANLNSRTASAIRDGAIEALRRHYALLAFFTCRRRGGVVRFAAPAPREHSMYHEGIDRAVCFALDIVTAGPTVGPSWQDNSPRRALPLVGLQRLAQQGRYLFNDAETKALVDWVLRREPAPSGTPPLALLARCRCAIETSVVLGPGGQLAAWQPNQGQPWDDPRPMIDSVPGEDVRELRAVDPAASFWHKARDGRDVMVPGGGAFWPTEPIELMMDLESILLAGRAVFNGVFGLGRDVTFEYQGEKVVVDAFRESLRRVVRLSVLWLPRQGAGAAEATLTFTNDGPTTGGRNPVNIPKWSLPAAGGDVPDTPPPVAPPQPDPDGGITAAPEQALEQALRTSQRLAAQAEVLAGMIKHKKLDSALAALASPAWTEVGKALTRLGNLIRRAQEATP